MSLEMLRFGWQKLLVNQVPQKGGRSYGPPPPDYAGQWAAAQNTIASAEATVKQVMDTQPTIARTADSGPIIQNNNNLLNGKISEIDGTINTCSAIPDYIFEGSLSKSDSLALLNEVRRNLAMCIGVVPPPPPAPNPPYTPPPTSAVLQSPLDLGPIGLFGPVGGALAGLTVPGLTTGQLPPLATTGRSICGLPAPAPPPAPPICPPAPVIQIPEVEFYPSQPAVVAGRGTWTCDGQILGVGTWTGDKSRIRAKVDEVWAEDGNQYPSPVLVPNGLRYSYTRWKFTPEYVPPPPPPPVYIPQPVLKLQTETEFYRQQIDRQITQLQKIGRVLNKPIDPVPPENIYPSTSWQYEFWQKGYSLNEISFAEESASKLRLLDSTNGDFELFKVKVEDLLQDSILANQLQPAIKQEIFSRPICGFDAVTQQPTVITSTPITSQPYQPQVELPVGEPTICPPPPPPCTLPMPFVDPKTGKNVDPKRIPPALRMNRNFISRKIFNRPVDLEDMPQVATCAPNTIPTKSGWEDCLVGNGASVAELDTVRRTMAQSKLTPNADVCAVAQNMLTTIRSQVAGRNVGGVQMPKDVANMFGRNPLTAIQGVIKCGVPPVNVVKSNAIAQTRTQQARGNVLNSRSFKR